MDIQDTAQSTGTAPCVSDVRGSGPEAWGRDYLPPQLAVSDPAHPGADECGVRQQGDRVESVSGEVGAHRTENDGQKGSRRSRDP